MAIVAYTPPEVAPNSEELLSGISAYSLRTKAMLSALGDYWTAYYRDLEPLASAATGSVAAISREYTHLLDIVRSSNILDVPIMSTDQFDLLVINGKDIQPVYDGTTLAYYFVPYAGVVATDYLTSSLFESQVVLKLGEHFDVIPGKGYVFYVDLFNDKGINKYTYELGDNAERKILFWACDIAFSSTVIYERYGRFLYKKSDDGEQYKWLVSGLMRFYESAKSLKGIQDVFNILYGVPYTRYKDEVVQKIYYVDKNLQPITGLTEEPYVCIETDKAKYYTYTFSELTYKVGDTVPQFSLLATINTAEDYISKPGWWEDVEYPDNLIEGANTLSMAEKMELMDKVLKYNLVHLTIGVSFDTYRTYLQQVKQFFQIIEGGFPVYLYPIVDAIFRIVFIDWVDIDEILDRIKAEMKMSTTYDWGRHIKFDGTEVYYMRPTHTHGKDYPDVPRLFDGKDSYHMPSTYGPRPTGSENFDGIPKYDTGWEFSHDQSNEIFTITKVGYRVSDNYPWSTSPGLAYSLTAKYDGSYSADGSIPFGYVTDATLSENERFDMSIRAQEFVDRVPVPREEFSADTAKGYIKPFESSINIGRFDGTLVYNIADVGAYTGVGEDFSLRVIRAAP